MTENISVKINRNEKHEIAETIQQKQISNSLKRDKEGPSNSPSIFCIAQRTCIPGQLSFLPHTVSISILND